MLKDTLAGKGTIKKYVDHKLSLFHASEHNLRALYTLMFSERENIFAEYTDGYKIVRITYGECFAAIERTAPRLAALLRELPQGAAVGLCLENSPTWIRLFWSILRAGYRPVLVNLRLSDETLEKAFAEYDIRAVIADGRTFSVRCISPEEIDACKLQEPLDDARFQDEVFFMSSNTSSHLKICGYTGERFYYQIMDSASILKRSRSIKRHDRGCLKLLAFLPFYHIFGFAAVYIWFCFFSRTLVFLKDYAPKTILNTVRKHRVTHIFSVPVLWEKIYKSAMAQIRERGEKTYRRFCRAMRLGDALNAVPPLGKLFSKLAFREVRENIFGNSISFMINGGGYLSEEAMRFINGIGYHLANGYGMTEIGITSVELSESAAKRNLRAVGSPFPSLEYRISEHGELLVRSRSMSHAIYSDGACIQIGGMQWFNTHDLFCRSGGRYYIRGRKDDLLIGVNGENLNPNLLEPQLATEGVARLCLLGLPVDRGSIVLLAEVSPYIDRPRLEQIRSALSERITQSGLGGQINRVLFTATPLLGKDDYKLARKQIAERLAAGKLCLIDPNAMGSDGEEGDRRLADRLRQIFAKALNRSPEEIADDAHFFFDLGGSSLDYFTMVTVIQAEFGVAFPASVSASVATVRDMKNFVKKQL